MQSDTKHGLELHLSVRASTIQPAKHSPMLTQSSRGTKHTVATASSRSKVATNVSLRYRKLGTTLYTTATSTTPCIIDIKNKIGEANAVFANTDIHDCQEAMQTLLHGVMAHTGATLIQTVQQEENSDAEEIWQLFVAQNSGQVFEKSTGMIQTTYRCGNREWNHSTFCLLQCRQTMPKASSWKVCFRHSRSPL